ncbi:SdiA-regulated domain-containing protein [Flavitalea sp. BT771]|uniref:SdiA-regulated domain-containing protein n=1 Tax=Flavitalea sp. BT771 TaxID=3063329 RepID=UPI0026E35153|nr:SdiA-regulated domain-containing protein [Flavitalea sp. BT771]MDO6431857.1 SdiA-regulated domain-containing protein [Flavitalea sp. BT771]MDV6220766.1 SdiA-regulated domain-containing protein [Flavitalea sp. BT771]
MMKIINLLFLMVLAGWACGDSGAPVASPPGYDLKSPEKFVMGENLHEISGIVFLPGKDDSLYAIEDEDGRLFYFKPGGDKAEQVKFGKRGDYEDVAVVNGRTFVVLRSDGSLYVFAAGDVRGGEKLQGKEVNEFLNVLPEGEYEGLYGTSDSTLYALCKNCKQDDQRDGVSGYKLRQQRDGSFGVTEHFTVDVSTINLSKEQRKGKFRPSALARHPITHEWYILSSVNKILLVLDDQWKMKTAYSLKPSLFKQPEGLAFDSKGNMYISNEGVDGNANVLLFKYNQPR